MKDVGNAYLTIMDIVTLLNNSRLSFANVHSNSLKNNNLEKQNW